MKTKQHPEGGFTLVELMIVVAIIGMLAAIAIPNFMRARKRSLSSACVNNLRQIDGAKHQWALETGGSATAVPNDTDIQPYLGRGEDGSLLRLCCPLVMPSTPMAGYSINDVATPPDCQHFDVSEHPAVIH